MEVDIFNETNEGIQYNKYPHNDRPVIVGFGPAGMFAALYLSRCGKYITTPESFFIKNLIFPLVISFISLLPISKRFIRG